MTSLQITYFLKAAESLSFSEAAKALYVSQPSVSRQIRTLEAELGYTLFDRSRKNSVRLTAEGLIYQEAFRKAQQALEDARTAAAAMDGRASLRLRVGVGAGWELSGGLRQFREQVLRQYPNAELTFTTDSFQQLRRLVRSGERDVILCTKTSLMDFDGLEVRKIADLESRAYVLRGLLRPEGEPLCAADFQGRRLLMLPEEESPMAMELALLQFQARQVRVEPVYLPDRDTILQAVLMGDGVAVFDQYMRFGRDPRLTWFNLEDDIPICAVWRQESRNPLIPLLAESLGAWMRENAETGRGV